MSNIHPLIDSHCHIHDSEFDILGSDAYEHARTEGVAAVVCVGTSYKSSHEARKFCQSHENAYYSLALHPHEVADLGVTRLHEAWEKLRKLAVELVDDPKFVAIGECGLDYFYHSQQSIREEQAWLLIQHLELAQQLQKPVIFHVREAFSDFWPVYDNFALPGVIHSFSSSKKDVADILERKELYIGLNGIMTFTLDHNQLQAACSVPLERLMLETDAPYLTPKPLRGKINVPANVRLVAEFLSDLRKEPLGLLADQTTTNTRSLFGF